MDTHGPIRKRMSTWAGRPAAACLLVTTVTVLALTGYGRDHARTPNTFPAPVASAAPLSPPVAPGPDYRTAVQGYVADQMHLIPQQVRDRLQADPNATLMTLSKPLGIAQDTLAPKILSALNEAADSAVRSGGWTTQQATEEKQFWSGQSQPALITEVSRWFREG
jgi:uncharacterized membrane protein